jgi:uncharacterized protein YhbP (UPF0306 family)
MPWAAAVFYANDEFDLYFFSHPGSRHGINMAANTRVSAAIYGDCRDWESIRGIQLEGRVELLQSAKLEARFWAVYRKRFPFAGELFHKPPDAVRLKLSGIRRYRLRPETVWYLDNRRGFGYRQRLDLAPGCGLEPGDIELLPSCSSPFLL